MPSDAPPRARSGAGEDDPDRHPSKRGTVFYGWVIVAVLGATTTVSVSVTTLLFGLLLVPMQEDLGWTRAQTSGLYACSFLVYAALVVFAGQLADRHGPRPLMAAGGAVAAVSLLGLTQVQELWQAYLLWGAGLGVTLALTVSEVPFIALANWFLRRRGAALAAFSTMSGLGAAILLPPAGWLIVNLGWRATLAATAALFLLTVPPCLLFLRRRPEDLGLLPDGEAGTVSAATFKPTGLTAREAVRRGAFWTIALSSTVVHLASGIVLVHQVAFLVGRGYDPVFVAGMVGLMSFVSVLGRAVLNLAIDRRGSRGLLVLVLVVQAMGVAALVLAPSSGWLFVYVALYGIGLGSIGGIRAVFLADHVGRRAYGRVSALIAFPSYVATAVGSLGAGWLFDVLGGYELTLWSAVAFYAISALSVLVTPAANASRWVDQAAGARRSGPTSRG